MRSQRVGRSVCLILAVLVGPSAAASSEHEPPDSVAVGEQLYRNNCMSCHGESGVGDGPMTEMLRVPPSDLTRLAAGDDGEFPRERVHATIDGREPVRGHGSRRMPIWGLTFQQLDRDTDQEPEVRRRIEALTD